MNNCERQIRRVREPDNLIQMEKSKDCGSDRNNSSALFGLMKEDKSMKEIHNVKRRIHQESKADF
jgi:hypothetical protein